MGRGDSNLRPTESHALGGVKQLSALSSGPRSARESRLLCWVTSMKTSPPRAIRPAGAVERSIARRPSAERSGDGWTFAARTTSCGATCTAYSWRTSSTAGDASRVRRASSILSGRTDWPIRRSARGFARPTRRHPSRIPISREAMASLDAGPPSSWTSRPAAARKGRPARPRPPRPARAGSDRSCGAGSHR